MTAREPAAPVADPPSEPLSARIADRLYTTGLIDRDDRDDARAIIEAALAARADGLREAADRVRPPREVFANDPRWRHGWDSALIAIRAATPSPAIPEADDDWHGDENFHTHPTCPECGDMVKRLRAAIPEAGLDRAYLDAAREPAGLSERPVRTKGCAGAYDAGWNAAVRAAREPAGRDAGLLRLVARLAAAVERRRRDLIDPAPETDWPAFADESLALSEARALADPAPGGETDPRPPMDDDCPDTCSRWPGCGHTVADFDGSAAPEDRAEGLDAGYTDADIETLKADVDLGAAWREAEAALPEGWAITDLTHRPRGAWTTERVWSLVAHDTPATKTVAVHEHGPDLAAALRALATRLRATTEAPE